MCFASITHDITTSQNPLRWRQAVAPLLVNRIFVLYLELLGFKTIENSRRSSKSQGHKTDKRFFSCFSYGEPIEKNPPPSCLLSISFIPIDSLNMKWKRRDGSARTPNASLWSRCIIYSLNLCIFRVSVGFRDLSHNYNVRIPFPCVPRGINMINVLVVQNEYFILYFSGSIMLLWTLFGESLRNGQSAWVINNHEPASAIRSRLGCSRRSDKCVRSQVPFWTTGTD